MPTQSKKIIVTNETALKAKYGQSYPQIQAALNKMVAADANRGINTIVVNLDHQPTMNALGGIAVAQRADPKQNKEAIDKVFNHYQPDYLVICGAVDVVPHQDLTNPLYTGDPEGDDDRIVPSDLPYASSGAYSTVIRDFINP